MALRKICSVSIISTRKAHFNHPSLTRLQSTSSSKQRARFSIRRSVRQIHQRDSTGFCSFPYAFPFVSSPLLTACNRSSARFLLSILETTRNQKDSFLTRITGVSWIPTWATLMLCDQNYGRKSCIVQTHWMYMTLRTITHLSCSFTVETFIFLDTLGIKLDLFPIGSDLYLPSRQLLLDFLSDTVSCKNLVQPQIIRLLKMFIMKLLVHFRSSPLLMIRLLLTICVVWTQSVSLHCVRRRDTGSLKELLQERKSIHVNMSLRGTGNQGVWGKGMMFQENRDQRVY